MLIDGAVDVDGESARRATTMSRVTVRARRLRLTWHGVAIAAAGVALTTLVVAVLERIVGVPDASAVYLVAVVVSAMAAGTAAALLTAVAAIVTHHLILTRPVQELLETDPGEWLSLALLAFVGIAVGQLVAIQRRRTQEAEAREQEAQDLYEITRVLANRVSTEEALGRVAGIVQTKADVERVWFALGAEAGRERVVADSGSGPRPVAGGTVSVLRRAESGPGHEWVRIHSLASEGGTPTPGLLFHRIIIEADGRRHGSVWAVRDRAAEPLDPTSTRLLGTVADQVGQAVRLDQLASQAAEAKVARQASELKTALVESVSHDLRTPLAAIRAAAGTLADVEVQLETDEHAEVAMSIDREAARLDHMVADLLDLGRIEGGVLRAAHEAVELSELVDRARRRVLAGRPGAESDHVVEVLVDEVWVDADPVLLGQAVSNVLQNALRHTPAGTLVSVSASPTSDGSWVRLCIEDAGEGVPEVALSRLFEKFYRAPTSTSSVRRGSGLGLAIVQGFVEAMGGHVSARRSDLGGLAVDIDLVPSRIPAELIEES